LLKKRLRLDEPCSEEVETGLLKEELLLDEYGGDKG
jgi:hypothetical protein